MLSMGSPPLHMKKMLEETVRARVFSWHDNANIADCKRRNETRHLFFLVVAKAGSADCLALLAAKIGKDARMRVDRRKETKTLSAALFGALAIDIRSIQTVSLPTSSAGPCQ